MQSKDYEPGVSGWKLHSTGMLEVHGVKSVIVPAVPGLDGSAPEVFTIVDGQLYIRHGAIQDIAADAGKPAGEILDMIAEQIPQTELSDAGSADLALEVLALKGEIDATKVDIDSRLAALEQAVSAIQHG